MAQALFELNPDLDRSVLAQRFAGDGRVQVRDVLTDATAREIRTILSQQTPWGYAGQADAHGESRPPEQILVADTRTPDGQQRMQRLFKATDDAARRGDYAYRYAQYSLVQSVQESWAPGGPHELLLEYLNAPAFLDLAREVTGIAELVKADGQATVYGANHFLGQHTDSHVAEGWRVAYVLNFTIDDWRPDWGGHLVFYDEDGDIEAGYRPRFNSLNMFAVPRAHAVQYVPPFAPLGRYAITGWLRDR